MLKVMAGWEMFCQHVVDADHKKMINSPPTFGDDRKVVALQAADLHAGWVRELNGAEYERKPLPVPPWGDRGSSSIVRINWIMPRDHEFLFSRNRLNVAVSRAQGLAHHRKPTTARSALQNRRTDKARQRVVLGKSVRDR